jgi:hypothetical protein
MAAHNTFSSTSTLRFPEWQQPYLAALMEADRKKLVDRVTDAENAIFNRLQALAGNADHQAERQAIEDALQALRVLKRHTLDFPDWEGFYSGCFGSVQ